MGIGGQPAVPAPSATLEEFDRKLLEADGVLPSHFLSVLAKKGSIRTGLNEVRDEQIQPASLDLSLSTEGYRIKSSFLPGKDRTVMDCLRDLKREPLDLKNGATLDPEIVYIVRLNESLNLSERMFAKANPKSTTGRLDVFARLITDNASEYDKVEVGYSGPLYVEIAPLHFGIVVREGSSLNQLRLLVGNDKKFSVADSALEREFHRRSPLVYNSELKRKKPDIEGGVWVSVDLSGEHWGGVIGYRARKDIPGDIDLSLTDNYEIEEYWEPIRKKSQGAIILSPGEFYLLVSRERVSIPPELAASMVAVDPSIGEFRSHYAGFFDPGFGYGANGSIRGTHAVLEVRSHEVPFRLEDGHYVGCLQYERLVEMPGKVYGVGIGSSYQTQGLALSKQFKRPG